MIKKRNLSKRKKAYSSTEYIFISVLIIGISLILFNSNILGKVEELKQIEKSKEAVNDFIVNSIGEKYISPSNPDQPYLPDESDENLKILGVETNKEIFKMSEKALFSISIENNLLTQKSALLGFSLITPDSTIIDIPMTEITVNPGINNIDIDLDFEDFHEIYSGNYSAIFSTWDNDKNGIKRTSTIRKNNLFKLYNFFDDFHFLNKENWYSREGILGESKLIPDNVQSVDSNLRIAIPKDSLDGGEIRSMNLVHYGSYEVSMKLPNAPSSITGFFLYKGPDFYHEIDIEIFNRSDSKLLLTTHYQGRSPEKEAVMDMPFDPTLEFNRYRIDYYPEYISFYLNDVLYQTWESGYSKEPMYIFVNTWYPSWLERIISDEDHFLEIDWIRY